jgi:hypothetical protein
VLIAVSLQRSIKVTEENNKNSERYSDTMTEKDNDIFTSSRDGMSTATARIAIDRKLRKKILEDYDLVELADKGRFYLAKAYSTDGQWLNELLIDKQTANIQVANRQRRGTEKER